MRRIEQLKYLDQQRARRKWLLHHAGNVHAVRLAITQHVSARGQHEHGNVCQSRFLRHHPRQFDTCHDGHLQISDDEVEGLALQQRERFVAIASAVDFESGVAKLQRNNLQDVHLVINNEDARWTAFGFGVVVHVHAAFRPACSSGIANQKREPTPTWESTPICPPCIASTIFRHRLSPRPVPFATSSWPSTR